MRSPSKDMALEITRAASGGTSMVADAVEESVQAAVRAHSSGGESRGTSYGRRCAELLWRSAALQKPVYNQLFCIQGLSSMSTARLRQWDPCKLDETWWNCRHATFLSTRRHYSDTFILRYHSFDTQVRHSLQKQSLTPVVCVCRLTQGSANPPMPPMSMRNDTRLRLSWTFSVRIFLTWA